MEEYILESVEEDEGSDERSAHWKLVYLKPDGTKHLHVIHKAAVGWRMAEYGLTKEEAIDVLLHERSVPEPNDPMAGYYDAAADAGMRMAARAPGKRPEPVTLWTAETQEEAREALLIRIEDAKQTKRSMVVPLRRGFSGELEDPLDKLREYEPPEEVLDVLRKIVTHTRQGLGLDKNLPAVEHPTKRRNKRVDVPIDPAYARRDKERRQTKSDVLFNKRMEIVDDAGTAV